MKHLAAAHGELHVRSGCDSPWCDTGGEHSYRRTSVPFRSNAAERAIVPHVAADADDVPRRGGRQIHTRPDALTLQPAAASERNAAQPDGVRLTPPCARRQVRHEVSLYCFIFSHWTSAPPRRFGPSRVGVRGAKTTLPHFQGLFVMVD